MRVLPESPAPEITPKMEFCPDWRQSGSFPTREHATASPKASSGAPRYKFSSPALIDQAQLTNDCNELKDMFCKCFVAGHRDLGASRLSVYALGKETPGDGLRDHDVSGNGGRKIACEAPGIVRPDKTPLATAIAGDFDKERCIICSRDVPVGMWQSPKKRV